MAARNVLLTNNGQTLKVADFGLAIRGTSVYMPQDPLHGNLPWRWYPPECFAYPPKRTSDRKTIFPRPMYTTKSDVWSYGVLLWEITTVGLTPYENWSPTDYLTCLVDEGTRLSIPDMTHETLKQIMSRCWSFEPPVLATEAHARHSLQETRPSFDNIWNDYFI